MSTVEKKIYKIKGVRFYQAEPEYLEHLRTLELVKDKFKALNANEMSLEQLIDKLMVEGTLEELFKIIVKPYEPNVVVKWLNRFFAKRNGIDVLNPILCMKTGEIARVVADFFLFYSHWIQGLVSFNRLLGPQSIPAVNQSPVEN